MPLPMGSRPTKTKKKKWIKLSLVHLYFLCWQGTLCWFIIYNIWLGSALWENICSVKIHRYLDQWLLWFPWSSVVHDPYVSPNTECVLEGMDIHTVPPLHALMCAMQHVLLILGLWVCPSREEHGILHAFSCPHVCLNKNVVWMSVCQLYHAVSAAQLCEGQLRFRAIRQSLSTTQGHLWTMFYMFV